MINNFTFIFTLTQKRTKNVKTAIFDVQSSFYSLKILNDSLSLTNLFYACFNGLKLVCKSYVDSKIRYIKWIWILKKDENVKRKTYYVNISHTTPNWNSTFQQWRFINSLLKKDLNINKNKNKNVELNTCHVKLIT